MLNANGMCKILKVIKEGEDKYEEKYASLSAVFRTQDGDQFVILKAFRSQASYILRNLGDSPRRAIIAGRMSIQETEKTVKVEKKVKIGDKIYKVPFDTKVKESVVIINLNDIEFIDKKKDGVVSAEEIPVADDEVIVILDAE